jgi:hypothetical protein
MYIRAMLTRPAKAGLSGGLAPVLRAGAARVGHIDRGSRTEHAQNPASRAAVCDDIGRVMKTRRNSCNLYWGRRQRIMLFHMSEESNIRRFEPRASEYTDEPVVWAIDAKRLYNFLVPRDCPRATYYAGHATTAAGAVSLLGGRLVRH